MNTLTEVINRRAVLNAERIKRQAEFKQFTLATEVELRELREAEALLAGGIDLERLRRGLQVVVVRGDLSEKNGTYPDQVRIGGRTSLVEEAKRDLASGAPHMRKQYFGIKNYAHFGDQREDHQYGYGPKHGDIVFSIGLTGSRRKNEEPLTSSEIEDGLYVLSNIHSIAAAQQSAAA